MMECVCVCVCVCVVEGGQDEPERMVQSSMLSSARSERLLQYVALCGKRCLLYP